jgi:hypothetical protein
MRKTLTQIGIGIILGIGAISAPTQAQAAKLPGTCDLLANTMCSVEPPSAGFSFGIKLPPMFLPWFGLS